MAVTAPLSKFRKNNLKIYIAACIIIGAWCAYDGFYNKQWIEDHTNADGTAQTYLTFNRKAPVYLAGAAILFGAYFFSIRDKKIIAENNELIIDGKERIPFNLIQKIDKTNFQSKGSVIITYKDQSGREINRKISDRSYDNLGAILNEVASKIS